MIIENLEKEKQDLIEKNNYITQQNDEISQSADLITDSIKTTQSENYELKNIIDKLKLEKKELSEQNEELSINNNILHERANNLYQSIKDLETNMQFLQAQLSNESETNKFAEEYIKKCYILEKENENIKKSLDNIINEKESYKNDFERIKLENEENTNLLFDKEKKLEELISFNKKSEEMILYLKKENEILKNNKGEMVDNISNLNNVIYDIRESEGNNQINFNNNNLPNFFYK
jgi:chromosome segregation ATPase